MRRTALESVASVSVCAARSAPRSKPASNARTASRRLIASSSARLSALTHARPTGYNRNGVCTRQLTASERRQAKADCVSEGYEVAVVETLVLDGNVATAHFICRGDFE